MTRTIPSLLALLGQSRLPPLVLRHAAARLALAMQVRRERRLLASLDARTLKDIGLSRADVMREAGRGLWDLPGGRMR